MARINVRVDKQVKKDLEDLARARSVRPSDIVREALEEYLGRRKLPESAFDLAVRAGILCAVKGLPSDLSMNPVYREGFGCG